MDDETLQTAKRRVRDFHAEFDSAAIDRLDRILERHAASDYRWRGVHPFNEERGASAACSTFWAPLRQSFSSMQRREDIFFAGRNVVDDGKTVWVAGMGHMLGLFDRSWLGIPATGRVALLRYAEFHRIEGEAIAESVFFCDIPDLMRQAGCYPLPPQTAAVITYPGPKTHDGIVLDTQPQEETARTIGLVNLLISNLSALNRSDENRCPPEILRRTWHEDMLWYGPAGIGSCYTIPRYQEQHQHPFRTQLKDKVFNGHVARFAEGHYAGFFGWPNLTNTPTGGFLGLPGNETRADMRVVDIYRRDGEKLAENWVFIDLLHWLNMQGLDLLARMRELNSWIDSD